MRLKWNSALCISIFCVEGMFMAVVAVVLLILTGVAEYLGGKVPL